MQKLALDLKHPGFLTMRNLIFTSEKEVLTDLIGNPGYLVKKFIGHEELTYIKKMYRIVAFSSTRIRPSQPLMRMVYTMCHTRATDNKQTNPPPHRPGWLATAIDGWSRNRIVLCVCVTDSRSYPPTSRVSMPSYPVGADRDSQPGCAPSNEKSGHWVPVSCCR